MGKQKKPPRLVPDGGSTDKNAPAFERVADELKAVCERVGAELIFAAWQTPEKRQIAGSLADPTEIADVFANYCLGMAQQHPSVQQGVVTPQEFILVVTHRCAEIWSRELKFKSPPPSQH